MALRWTELATFATQCRTPLHWQSSRLGRPLQKYWIVSVVCCHKMKGKTQIDSVLKEMNENTSSDNGMSEKMTSDQWSSNAEQAGRNHDPRTIPPLPFSKEKRKCSGPLFIYFWPRNSIRVTVGEKNNYDRQEWIKRLRKQLCSIYTETSCVPTSGISDG